ncbi:Protein N-acetyltransferase, RimJ/RimL family [Geosmithia morbida]|uniref:Protein N-acetyltransferase, RimJ/RimL family n=1 Tax=Geosmithia morbida TaxID=1094350 RepID=A0A9P4YYL5_9HYPO|nr:Protein N-acetyltransferase, RimJ/RimL family [Geosmithia morbida]KAF4125483.1 Protein N-acetyltransferase, RimJ/RimL family [Geosmithia morbida]
MPIPAPPPGDIAPSTPATPPQRTTILGRHVALEPISPAHSPSLFANLGGESNASLWTYIPGAEAPATQEEMDAMVSGWVASSDPHFYAVVVDGEALGTLAYLAIVPDHRRIELGFVVLGTKLQKTRAATEAFYLILRQPFEQWGYDRLEWKANSFNKPSLAAAGRLGFVYEGTFRKHIITKGHRRDTVWFSITDDEWPLVKKGLVSWLDDANFDDEGRQRRSLKEYRS